MRPAVLLVAIMSLAAQALFSQEIDAHVLPSEGAGTPGGRRVSATVRGIGDRVVLEPLGSGLKSEIEFVLRQYEESRGFGAVLGDRLIGEERHVYVVQWDPFSEEYVLHRLEEGERVLETRYRESGELLADFFSTEDMRVPQADTGGESYLLMQARIQPVRFVPALGILAILLPDDTVSTPWTRVPLSEAAEP
ncbi:MAG: hypothetical protein ACLFO1_04595 [Spirochaetaceae bacterium]